MLDVGDVVLDLSESGQGLSRDCVTEVLLDLHGDFDSVEGVEAVVCECAILGDTCID